MKVQKTLTQPVFQPIELKITIESTNELFHLKTLKEASTNIRIVLEEQDALDSETLEALEYLLDDIGECL